MLPPANGQDLGGCGVLVTRPVGFNDNLSTLLKAVGATVFEFPLLSIEGCPARDSLMAPGIKFDWLIFTSRNAVEYAFRQWPQLGSAVGATAFCAVGAGSAKALAAKGVAQVLIPLDTYSTEGLLALAEFCHPAGLRIGVVTGQGGRTLLVDSLRERGARVDCFEVYRRLPADADVTEYLRHQGQEIHIVVITSAQALRVFIEGAGRSGRGSRWRLPLVVASARIAALAQQSGCTAPIEIAGQVCDEALVQGCVRLWQLIGK